MHFCWTPAWALAVSTPRGGSGPATRRTEFSPTRSSGQSSGYGHMAKKIFHGNSTGKEKYCNALSLTLMEPPLHTNCEKYPQAPSLLSTSPPIWLLVLERDLWH